MKPLKRAVLKEELLVVTGDPYAAIILQQLLFWTERLSDFEAFVNEERENAGNSIALAQGEGWFYKSARQLSEETMLAKERTVAEKLQGLVDMGFVGRRKNPVNKRDRCWQYRVNLCALQKTLLEKGYMLEKFPFVIPVSVSDVEQSSPRKAAESHPRQAQMANPPSAPHANDSIRARRGTIPKIIKTTENTKSTDKTFCPNLPVRTSQVVEGEGNSEISSFVRSHHAYVTKTFGKIAPPLTQQTYASAEKTLDLMTRKDGFPLPEIIETLQWASNDPFWRDKVLSIPELRSKKNGSTMTKFQKILAAKESAARAVPAARKPQKDHRTPDRWHGRTYVPKLVDLLAEELEREVLENAKG